MTCQNLISDLSGVESPSAATLLSLPRTRRPQRQLRPRRVDGGTPRHLLCAAVYSAGSQLPLEGTERDNSAQMVKSRFCNASCATVKWN